VRARTIVVFPFLLPSPVEIGETDTRGDEDTMTRNKTTHLTIAAGLAFAAIGTACQGPEHEFLAALPQRDAVIVDVPAANGTQSQGLSSANTGTKRQAVVGQAAEFYTDSYYISRDLNALAAYIIDILEAVTKLKPSGINATSAVWGPFSNQLEPNEWILNIDKQNDGIFHFTWKIAGKPKGAPDSAYLAVAYGAFEPGAKEEQGKGWFTISFDNVHTLDPTQTGAGSISYAIGKDDKGVLVLAHYVGVSSDMMQAEAGYAYGKAAEGYGFMVFAFPADIDNGQDGMNVKEDVLLRTRWMVNGEGRADIVAVHGTLGASVVQGSQCWGNTFVSSYEDFELDGKVLATAGDSNTCVFAQQQLPQGTELPVAETVKNPHLIPGVTVN
jgi:hypothetical protein